MECLLNDFLESSNIPISVIFSIWLNYFNLLLLYGHWLCVQSTFAQFWLLGSSFFSKYISSVAHSHCILILHLCWNISLSLLHTKCALVHIALLLFSTHFWQRTNYFSTNMCVFKKKFNHFLIFNRHYTKAVGLKLDIVPPKNIIWATCNVLLVSWRSSLWLLLMRHLCMTFF